MEFKKIMFAVCTFEICTQTVNCHNRDYGRIVVVVEAQGGRSDVATMNGTREHLGTIPS
jgi:hypothetical protein